MVYNQVVIKDEDSRDLKDVKLDYNMAVLLIWDMINQISILLKSERQVGFKYKLSLDDDVNVSHAVSLKFHLPMLTERFYTVGDLVGYTMGILNRD